MKKEFEQMPSRNYWLESCHRNSTSASLVPDSVDVIVVGSGVTGLVASLFLGRAGLRVLVLDKDEIASGSSTRNAGIMVLGYKLSPKSMVDCFGLEATVAFYRMSLDSFDFVASLVSDNGIDCDYRSGGHLEVAAKQAHLRGIEEIQVFYSEHLNHHLKLIAKQDIGSYIQSDRYFGGSLDPKGCSLNPQKYMLELTHRASEAGVLLCPNTEAISIQRRKGGFVVNVGSKKVSTERIIMATNALTGRIVPWLQSRIVAVGSHMIATEELPREIVNPLINGHISVSDTKRFLYYFRLSPDRRRLLFGGRTRFSASNTDRDIFSLRNSFLEVFPQLCNFDIEYAWSGLVGFTRDFLPHLGNHEGIHYALGYNGGGVAIGSYLGACLAKNILGNDSKKLPIEGRPFSSFPLIYGYPWFLPAAHLYYKFLDLLW